jgi:hypothetical protein
MPTASAVRPQTVAKNPQRSFRFDPWADETLEILAQYHGVNQKSLLQMLLKDERRRIEREEGKPLKKKLG